MTYLDIVKECKKHIKDRAGVRTTECDKCKYFPVRARTMKRICDCFENETGIPTDDYIRKYLACLEKEVQYE